MASNARQVRLYMHFNFVRLWYTYHKLHNIFLNRKIFTLELLLWTGHEHGSPCWRDGPPVMIVSRGMSTALPVGGDYPPGRVVSRGMSTTLPVGRGNPPVRVGSWGMSTALPVGRGSPPVRVGSRGMSTVLPVGRDSPPVPCVLNDELYLFIGIIHSIVGF